MTVGCFLDYCIEPCLLTVEIYSLDKGKVVWIGEPGEMPDEYADAELAAFDPPREAGYLTLNID